MNRKIAYWSVTVAVSGFLFGFDTAVISGADQPLQKLWDSSDLFHGLFVMSSVLSAFQPSSIFAFFAGMMVLQLLFVLFMMPETRGQSLESLAEDLSRHD